MWALGDKVASTIVAQTLEIPTLPWSGSGECLLTASTPSLFPPSLLPASPSLQNKHQDWGPWPSWPQILGTPSAAADSGRGILEMGCMETSEMMESSAPWAHPSVPPQPMLVVTIALAISVGLVAQWSEEDQKDQQTISIPLETYAQGCVKDLEEGLEVKLSL